MSVVWRGERHLGQERLAHQIHAPHVCAHGEVPVVLLTVQNGAMVHEAEGGVEVSIPSEGSHSDKSTFHRSCQFADPH